MATDISGAIVVLGSPNTKDGRLYDVAIQRCELALSEYNNHPDYKFLLTGGYGTHFNESNKPHAFYLTQYLIKFGVSEKNVLEFAESANSIEDAILSRQIIQKHNIKKIIVITSDYHINRAQYIFKKIYRDLNIEISFNKCKSDIKNSKLDILQLIKHEKFALRKLKKIGIGNYYNQ